MKNMEGLTILETVVAIAICAVVLGGLALVTSSSLREGRAGTFKTQTTQILSAIGRQISGGEDHSLLLPPGGELVLTGEGLEDRFDTGQYDSNAFEVVINNAGTLTIGVSTLDRYEVSVCVTATGSAERCVNGVTLALRAEP